jgi:hypothetical protein
MRLKLVFSMAVILLAAACGSAGPADAADITLRYVDEDYPDDPLVIQADSAGNIAAREGDGQAFFVLGGETYLVIDDEYGQSVVRFDDYLSVAADIRQLYIDEGLVEPEPQIRHELTDLGEQAIGEWRGTAYRLRLVDDPRVPVEVTVSDDPALADAAPAAQRVFTLISRLHTAFGLLPEEYARAWRDLYTRGMPIAADGRVLESVERGPIPEESFALPGEPITRETLAERGRRRLDQRPQQ